MPRLSARQQKQIAGLATRLEHQVEDAVEQIEFVHSAWVRRRLQEGRYRTVEGEQKELFSVFDIWFEQSPEERPRDPDTVEHTAYSAAERLFKYEGWEHID